MTLDVIDARSAGYGWVVELCIDYLELTPGDPKWCTWRDVSAYANAAKRLRRVGLRLGGTMTRTDEYNHVEICCRFAPGAEDSPAVRTFLANVRLPGVQYLMEGMLP